MAEAYAGFAAPRWRQELDPARMFVVPDVMWGLFEVLLVATEAGDRVVVNPPVYAPFFDTIAHARRRLVEVALVRDADGRHLTSNPGRSDTKDADGHYPDRGAVGRYA